MSPAYAGVTLSTAAGVDFSTHEPRVRGGDSSGAAGAAAVTV